MKPTPETSPGTSPDTSDGTSPGAGSAPAGPPQALTSQVVATLVPGTAVRVRAETRQHVLTIDEPPELGGTDEGANPVEHLLAALGSCQVVTFRVWSRRLGIRLSSVDVDVTGDLDLRGFLGTADGVRPGFQRIRVAVTIDGPEPPERYAELVRAVEAHCPVLDSIAGAVPVESTFSVS